MRLAFCLYHYFPYGGLQRDFLRIARLCLERGHHVEVYTQQWEGEKVEGLKIHYLPVRGLQNHTRYQSFADQLQLALKDKNYDLVLGFNKVPGLDVYYAADVCYQRRIKEQRPFWYRGLPRYRTYLKNEQAVFAKDKQTQFLVLAAQQLQAYSTCYQVPEERFHLLPPGIAKDRLAPENAAQLRADFRAKQQIKEDEKILLMVGSGFKTKGLDRIIKGLAALPQALRAKTKLWVLGQDKAQPFLAQAKKYGVQNQLQFLGAHSEVLPYYLAADLLVHPAYHDNTGTVLLEAIAAGLPVLTVEACGYAPYIESAQAGQVLAAPYQQQAFNQALSEILSQSSLEKWRANALHFAKTADLYSLPDKALAFIEAYQK